MGKDKKGSGSQHADGVRWGVTRQNSERGHNAFAPQYHTPVQRSAFSGSFASQPHPGPQLLNVAQAPSSGHGMTRYPSWPSLPPMALQQANTYSFAPPAIALAGRANSMGPHVGGPPMAPWGTVHPGPPGYPFGPHENYRQPAKNPNRQPAFLLAVNVVSFFVLILHVPVAVFYANFLNKNLIFLTLGPVGSVLTFIAVYINPCECSAHPELIAKRIRRLVTAAAIIDALACCAVPVIMYRGECPDPEEEPELAKGCLRVEPFAMGVAYFLSFVILVHMLLALVLRWRACMLSTRNTEPQRPVTSFTGLQRSFSMQGMRL